MKGMNKKIQMHYEGLVHELKKVGADCVIVWHDHEHDKGANAVLALTPESAILMFEELFSRNPYLIPKALAALAMVMDDVDFDEEEDDDDDDGDGPDEGDGVPVDGCANEYAMCMN